MSFKKIKIGNLSIGDAMRRNLAYVDKTRFIDLLENECDTDAPVFLRPRRFGKTFFTYMLYNYYDKSLAGKFEQNFKGTWIYEHKTAMASSYCCLRFDFSSVSSDPCEVKQSTTEELINGMRDFTDRYPELGLPYEQIEQAACTSPASLLKTFMGRFKTNAKKGERIFVIIDEYDHFANDLLSSDKDAFREITSTACGHVGIIKQLYITFKQFYGNGDTAPIERFFITGVSAVSLDSLVSGFNIATNISAEPEFAAMAGFTHGELSKLIDETVDFKAMPHVSKDALMSTMEKYYDGYSFSGGKRVFNPNMCLAFISGVVKSRSIPDSMPGKAGDDAGRLDGLLKLAEEKARDAICDKIFRRDSIDAGEPGEMNLNRSGSLNFDQAVWMLYYLGYLTRGEDPGATTYRCPNEKAYQAFADYLAVKAGFSTAPAEDLYAILKKGDAKGLAMVAENCMSELPDTAFSGFNERSVQLCFHYILRWRAGKSAESCPEADTGDHGRADLYVRNHAGGPDLLLEFKYISKSKADDAKVAKALAEARSKLERYKSAPSFRDNRSLRAYAMVFVGPKAMRIEEA